MQKLISHRKRREEVPGLFDWVHDRPINMAASRNFCGDFFEEATAVITGGHRLRTDCQFEICPDVRLPLHTRVEDSETYAESKCIGMNDSAIVYTHRLEKDRRFRDELKQELFYFFWRHSVAVQSCSYLFELREALSRDIQGLCVMPLSALEKCLEGRPTRLLNTHTKTPAGKRLGYGTNGYGQGWSIPCKHLAAACERPVYDAYCDVVYGYATNNFEIHLEKSVPSAIFRQLRSQPKL
jgi:hypothetical protein